jgi:RimJ/RimL family protein N-acetyltransferase
MIETARLVLREYTPEDFPTVHRIFSDAVTMQFWPRPFTEEEMQRWIDRTTQSYASHGFGRRVVVLKETLEVIGDAGMMRVPVNGNEENDLGYIIHHPYWRQGYGVEAAAAILRLGLETGVTRIVANMAHDNIASQRAAERIGMKKELEFRNPRNRDILTFLYSYSNEV